VSIPSTELRQHILTGDSRCGHAENVNGNLIPTSMTETLDDEAADTDHEFTEEGEGTLFDSDDISYSNITESLLAGPSSGGELGWGKRHKKANTRYFGNHFWENA
jgi:hypothetical protein